MTIPKLRGPWDTLTWRWTKGIFLGSQVWWWTSSAFQWPKRMNRPCYVNDIVTRSVPCSFPVDRTTRIFSECKHEDWNDQALPQDRSRNIHYVALHPCERFGPKIAKILEYRVASVVANTDANNFLVSLFVWIFIILVCLGYICIISK